MQTRPSTSLFVLHVELACPDSEAANRVLFGLERCAAATRIAGPGVPTYLFHRSAPVTRRIRSTFPNAVGLEYFEFYLDGSAFWHHADSDEFRAGFNEVTNPADRISRHVYVAGHPPSDVTTTRVWANLKAQPLALLQPLIFDARKASGRGDAEYVSLYIDRPQAADPVEPLLEKIARDPAWICLLMFAHPASPRAVRLMGVRTPTPLGENQAHWAALHDAVSGVEGTSIAMASAPLADFLGKSWAIQSIAKDFSGYALHPDAGHYTSQTTETHPRHG